MNKEFNYSFIIPHKNCPDLLQRCVDSIPERDDVQVIVVDDNSEEGKKPSLRERKNLQVVLLDATQSKGAGRARNVGLEHAEGKWLLFADCDDFYTDGFIDILDKYTDMDLDIVYFDAYDSPDSGKTLKYVDKTKCSISEVKYKHRQPWNKMFNHEFIKHYNLLFEEVICGNDMRFVILAGLKAKKVALEHSALYVYSYNPESITNKKHSIENRFCAFLHNVQRNAFFKDIGVKGLNVNHLSYFKDIILQDGLLFFIKLFAEIICNIRVILNRRLDFVRLK